MDEGRFAVPAAVTDWAIAVGVVTLLLATGLSEPHPARPAPPLDRRARPGPADAPLPPGS